VRRLLFTANVVPSSPILVTLMMEALRSFETSFLTRATWRNIPEDGIHHSYRRENLKSYKTTTCCLVRAMLHVMIAGGNGTVVDVWVSRIQLERLAGTSAPVALRPGSAVRRQLLTNAA
jgi:hypothetical protein